MESLHTSTGPVQTTQLLVALLAVLLAGATARAQAPTPALDGLPTGVARIPFTQDTKTVPNPKDSPDTPQDHQPDTVATPEGDGEFAPDQPLTPASEGRQPPPAIDPNKL